MYNVSIQDKYVFPVVFDDPDVFYQDIDGVFFNGCDQGVDIDGVVQRLS